MTPRALDLFCGAGGATKGLQRAGFHVTGVDIKRQPRYCGDAFVQADALKPPFDLSGFDLIWASPPCQRFSQGLDSQPHRRALHPDLIEPVRLMLLSSGRAWVIENVPRAPIRADVVLHGAQFGLLVARRRHFECSGFRPPFALHQEHMGRTVSNGGLAVVAGNGCNNAWNLRRSRDGKAIKWRDLPRNVVAALKARNSAAGWREAMGIDWMTRNELKESIPPAYSEFIGRAALNWMQREAA